MPYAWVLMCIYCDLHVNAFACLLSLQFQLDVLPFQTVLAGSVLFKAVQSGVSVSAKNTVFQASSRRGGNINAA